MLISYYWKKVIPQPPEGNFPNYHAKILHHILIYCYSFDTISIKLYIKSIEQSFESYFMKFMSLRWQIEVLPTNHHGHNLFCLPFFPNNFWFFCFYLSSDMPVLINYNISNALLWLISGFSLSFVICSIIFLRTSEISVIRSSLTSKSGWVLLCFASQS